MPNLYKIPTHHLSPVIVNAIIEIPKGTSTKYEYDPNLQVFKLDRCLTSAMVYPANYGFIPNTLGDDGDPLDIMLYTQGIIQTGTLVECVVIGALDMEDDGDKDYKILARPKSSLWVPDDIHQIRQDFMQITKNFFEHYKDLDRKKVVCNGWLDRETTYDIIRKDTGRRKK